MDRLGAVAREQREVMHFARRARLDDEARATCAGPCLHQMLVHGGGGEQRGNRQQSRRHACDRTG